MTEKPFAPLGRGLGALVPDLEAELGELARRSTNGGSRALPDPIDKPNDGIAKMAGAAVSGIADSIIASINQKKAEVDALRDAVHRDGDALIEKLRVGSAKIEEDIGRFHKLQGEVQLAFSRAANNVATLEN